MIAIGISAFLFLAMPSSAVSMTETNSFLDKPRRIDRFKGTWIFKDYLQELRSTKSPLKAFEHQGQDGTISFQILNSRGSYLWSINTRFHEGWTRGIIEDIKPTSHANVYEVILDTTSSNPYALLPREEIGRRFLEIIRQNGNDVREIKWRERPSEVFVKADSPLKVDGWVNAAVIAGKYSDHEGRKYIFTSSSEAKWPERSFRYEVLTDFTEVDEPVPKCDIILIKSAKAKESESIGFRWEDGKLQLLKAASSAATATSNAADTCSDVPFLILTPEKSGASGD